MGMKFTRSGESSHWSWWMGRRAEGAAKVYIKAERGRRRCEIHSKQIPFEEQRPHGLPFNCLFYIYIFPHWQPGIVDWHGGFGRKQLSEYLFSVPPLFPLFVFSFFPGKRRTFISASLCWTIWIWMRKIHFIPSLTIVTLLLSGWKTAPAKTTRRCMSRQRSAGHLPSLATVSPVLHERSVECACTTSLGFLLLHVFFFLSVSNYRDTTNKSTVKSCGLHFVASHRDIPARPCVYVTSMLVYPPFISIAGPFKRKK